MTDSCVKNYCQDGLHVYFATETQDYTYANIYGYYELQPNDVNGRPYFQKPINYGFYYGLWWDGIGSWFIGIDVQKGKSIGLAWYDKDVFCPHQLYELNWRIWDGSNWSPAGNDLGINCKCIFIQTKLTEFHIKI